MALTYQEQREWEALIKEILDLPLREAKERLKAAQKEVVKANFKYSAIHQALYNSKGPTINNISEEDD